MVPLAAGRDRTLFGALGLGGWVGAVCSKLFVPE